MHYKCNWISTYSLNFNCAKVSFIDMILSNLRSVEVKTQYPHWKVSSMEQKLTIIVAIVSQKHVCFVSILDVKVISHISLIVNWKAKWIAHRHCKYFIDLFAKKFINNLRVSFLSCTSGILSSQGTEILSNSDLINLQLIRINKTELCSLKEHVRRKPSAPVQDTMIVACARYNVL